MNARDQAQRFVSRGWVPIPIPPRAKAPRLAGWQRVTRENALDNFRGAAANVGVLLGEPSQWLVDIDLDCAEARELAPLLLPATSTFGRSGSRRSHWLYVAEGAETEKFVVRTETILELRSTGCQTVFPPSVHVSGEAIEYDQADAQPLPIAAGDLRTHAARLAAAALMMRNGAARDAAIAFARGGDAPAGVSALIVALARNWLAGASSTPAPRPAPPPPRRRAAARTYADAVAAWNADHPLQLPRHSAPCPVCNDKASFGRLPDDEQRWYCFSTDHPDNVGLRSDRGHHGDALDLDAFMRGITQKQVLIDDGYYAAAPRSPQPRDNEPPPMPSVPPEAYEDAMPPPDDDAGGDVVPIDRGRRMYRNNSYLTCVQIIEGNEREVLGARARLEFDEMSGRVMLNRRPLEDTDELSVRAEIERRFSGGVDGAGNQKGLKQSLGDVRAAMLQVARSRSYHPVREFLSALKWDGTPRLDSVAEDILGAERTMLNQALIRRYMVSAVARAMQPGCKVDTALILVGPTGLGKSTFFRIIGSPWFIDTKLKIDTPKALMTLRRAWIYEWAELEVMRRAEDINEIKAWISSPVDEYVPQYGHHSVEVPRGFVIAGTTESEEFLVDEKGNRRFWPLRITAVHRAALRDQREQLWAEATSIYNAWAKAGSDEDTAPWVLSVDEARALDAIHAVFQETDSWGDLVLMWAEKQLTDFTTADVLEHAIQKVRAQRNRGDDMRVAKILKRAGWRLGNKPEGRSRPWVRK